jgi:nucleoside-diphosphate-sugar epimerase
MQVGDGTNQISVVYVENAAAAHLQAAERLTLESPVSGNAYFINEKESVSLWGWIGDILNLAGQSLPKHQISHRTAYAAGMLMECVYTLLRLKAEPNMTRFLANQLAQYHTYKIDRAEGDFGYHSIVSFEEGMSRLADDLPRMMKLATEQ